MATGSYLTPIYSRSQSEVLGDHHNTSAFCASIAGNSSGKGVPSRHEGTLNSRRAASPFVRLVEGEKRSEAPDHPQGILPQNWGETELNRSVACLMLKATAYDRRLLALCHDEFRWL
ncbi:uncharacterized protein TNCV_3770791 [Trichonephila clavipes]|nr:uncharacterized protein TNCV_3770791 [Trichonephila clavipes]